MDEIIYDSLTRYYNALEKKGSMPYAQMVKLLVLIFYRNFMYRDYRGIIRKEDYQLMDRALDCLFGTSCLIPYPDYLKMGKLHLGEMTEVAYRVKALEETMVLKAGNEFDENSDVLLMEENGQG